MGFDGASDDRFVGFVVGCGERHGVRDGRMLVFAFGWEVSTDFPLLRLIVLFEDLLELIGGRDLWGSFVWSDGIVGVQHFGLPVRSCALVGWIVWVAIVGFNEPCSLVGGGCCGVGLDVSSWVVGGVDGWVVWPAVGWDEYNAEGLVVDFADW
jgi:hypothetical protein